MSRIILGITGASGGIYATRLAMHLKKLGHEVWAIPTETARKVLDYEKQTDVFSYCDGIWDVNDFFAECASGSSSFVGMAVVPCSMGTLGKMANGIADNLLSRSADVCLKERRPLVIVPREMPYHAIHLENMLRLTHAGAIVIPACPHFYNHPESIECLVDTVVAKVLSHLGISHSLSPTWGTPNA